jgi:hypothetical protein
MKQAVDVLPILQKRFDSTCKVVLGEEIGALPDYKDWLLKYVPELKHRLSSASGEEITFSIPSYIEGSKWIGFDEIDFTKKAEPLTINEIKDFDSLVAALRERFAYAGSSALGNSQFVERSSNITDSFYMLETGRLTECKYIAYSTLGRTAEDCFGCHGLGESKFLIKCHETFRDTRCLELWQSRSCSDCYFSHNLDDCQEAIFCFNAKNLRHAIGNLALDRGKYAQLKRALLSEMAQKLKKEKQLPTLVEIFGKCPSAKTRLSIDLKEEGKTDKVVIETAFAATCHILLGKKLPGGIDDYGGWLNSKIPKSQRVRSCVSGKDFTRWDYCCYFEHPKERLVSLVEARKLGESQKASEASLEGLNLGNAAAKLCDVAYFCPEYRDGANLNMIEVPNACDSANCYRSSPVVYSKDCGYCYWPRSSEHAFGCGALLSSEFCMHCYNSVKLSRCFEVDFSRDCADCYFSHNIENCHDTMFCFNAKNLKYAIGNVEVGRENYLLLKSQLLGLILRELENTHSLSADIYGIGVKKGK